MRRLPALFLVLLIGAPAFGQTIEPGREGVLAGILPPKPGTEVCFSRSYSKDHLAAHPKQKVMAIDFRLAYHRHDPDKFFPKGQRNYYFKLIARLRDKTRRLSTIGECSASGGDIRCQVECDGGGVLLRKRAGDKLLVYFEPQGSIMLKEGCDGDDADAYELKAGADDREFLLSQAGTCPAYEKW